MTLDVDSVAVRLNLIVQYLSELSQLNTFTRDEIIADFYKYRAAERLLELIIQASLDVNRHLLKEIHQLEPKTNAEVFLESVRVGIVHVALGNKLAEAAKFRNVLTHLYEKIDPEIVLSAISPTLVDYPAYINAIDTYLDALEVDDA